MAKYIFALCLVLVLVLAGTMSESSDVQSAPTASTVFGAITSGDSIRSFQYDGTFTQLGLAYVNYIGFQTFHSAAYLPTVETNAGPGLLVAWLQDSTNPSLEKIRIYKTNGVSAGSLVQPQGLEVDGAGRFMAVNDKLFAELFIDSNSRFFVWNAGLYAQPTEIIFPSIIMTVRQLGYHEGTFAVGSGPNGRITVVEDGNLTFELPSNDNFRSQFSQVTSDGTVYGEVDGSIYRISGQNHSWIRTANDIQELAGSANGLLLASTYTANGTGIVSYEDGNLLQSSQMPIEIDTLSAASEYGIVVSGNQAKIISLVDHAVLYTFTAPENITYVNMVEAPVLQEVFNIYLPMLTN